MMRRWTEIQREAEKIPLHLWDAQPQGQQSPDESSRYGLTSVSSVAQDGKKILEEAAIPISRQVGADNLQGSALR